MNAEVFIYSRGKEELCQAEVRSKDGKGKEKNWLDTPNMAKNEDIAMIAFLTSWKKHIRSKTRNKETTESW